MRRRVDIGDELQSEVLGWLSFRQPNTGVQRVPLFRCCRLQELSGDASGVMCNLSVRGSYVAVDPVPTVGDRVLVSFQLPWWEDPLNIDAVVSWDNSDCKVPGLPRGCGLEFLAQTTLDRVRIESFLRVFGSSDRGKSDRPLRKT